MIRFHGAASASIAGAALVFLAGCAGNAAPPAVPLAAQRAANAASVPPPMRVVVPATAPSRPSVPQLAAEADPLFARCAACHSLRPGINGLGPSLAGIWGRRSAMAPNFRYSEGMAALGVTWDAATLDRWLTDPDAMVAHTRMTFAGMGDPLLRASIIAFLQRESTAPRNGR